MNFDAFREYCLSKQKSEETMPFGEDALVFKVMGKMFALIDVNKATTANLKCDPDRAVELRAQFPDDVLPGYHMNKKHWNTVVLQGRLKVEELEELIDHSYNLVVSGLKKSDRDQLHF